MKSEKMIIDEINNNEKIKRYKELEVIINNNEEIKSVLNKIKSISKEIVHAREYKLDNAIKKLEEDYDTLYNSLFDYPLLNEYLDLQTEINGFLKNFSNTIETLINNELMAK